MALQDFLLNSVNATLSDPAKSSVNRYLGFTGDPNQVRGLVEQEIRRAIERHNPEVRLTSIETKVDNGSLRYSLALQSLVVEFVYDGKYKYDGANQYQGYRKI